MTIRLHIASDLELAAEPLLDGLCADDFATRLFAQDASLWGPEAAHEAAQRLGWVDPFEASRAVLAEAAQLRAELHARGITQILLCGMGGSSLGPEVIARAAGVDLTLVDSTHPTVIRHAIERDLAQTAVVISSKSGGTLETRTHSEIFREAFLSASLDPAQHLIYVTDPGSPLEALREEGYRVFLADPTVGGRFSALTAFGIVPTVLAGADMSTVLEDAKQAGEALRLDARENPALRLAATLAAGLPGRYVLLLTESETSACGLGDWVEQLVAESTGKQGKGVLPISLSADAHEVRHPPLNSLRVRLGAAGEAPAEIAIEAPLGAQLLLWEVATAALGRLMGINPFDQPDVEAAKIAAHSALEQRSDNTPGNDERGPLAEYDEDALIAELSEAMPTNGYLAIQAFVDRDSAQGDAARRLRDRLADELGVPVALGWGPRYLHSTGQLHKGGPALGVYLQLVDTTAEDLALPGRTHGIAALMRAQARGDHDVLQARGRAVVTLEQ